MPSSFLEAYNVGFIDKPSHLPTKLHRNNLDFINGSRLSPTGGLKNDIRPPPTSPRTRRAPKKLPGYPRQVETVSTKADAKQHTRRASDERVITYQKKHIRSASDDTRQCLTPPLNKKQFLNTSSSATSIRNLAHYQQTPPQMKRDGRMSPVRLFKRPSTSTSSLGSVQSIEEESESNRFYIAPGRSQLPHLDYKRGRTKSQPTIINLTQYNSPSPTPKRPLPAIPKTNAARLFYSPQPPRKGFVNDKSAITPPRRQNIPAPLVLTPPSPTEDSKPSSPKSPGPPRRQAPLPPMEKSSSKSRLSPMPSPSHLNPSSPKLPPKPPHLQSSPSPRKSPVSPCHFSYTPPPSPGAISSTSDAPPSVPARVLEAKCRAPLPPPPVTSQPRSGRAPIPPPKSDLPIPPAIVTNDCPEFQNHPQSRFGKHIPKSKHSEDRHRRDRGRRSPHASRQGLKGSTGNKDKEEEDGDCCSTCLKDCVADLPEYLLDFFC